MTEVELSHVTKRYTIEQCAVHDVSLVLPDGKITALLGPSGCGKTTILKMIAGLLPPTAGDIRFDGRSVLAVPAERRGAVMVFQNYLLFPHLNVENNVAFGLKMDGMDSAEIGRRVGEMLELVQLTGYERRKPSELSGGQQQRVALARALVVEPQVLLLDEPLSNLDVDLREEMRELIRGLQRRQGITTVFVTHDQEEAVMMADQLALVIDGRLQQVGEPWDFYNNPANLQVARFFRTRNFLPGRLSGGQVVTSIGKFVMNNGAAPEQSGTLIIRPENIRILASSETGGSGLRGTVRKATFTGKGVRLQVLKDGQVIEILTDAESGRKYRQGDVIDFQFPKDRLSFLKE